MENKSGYPHPQQGMSMPMPPTYDQTQGVYPPPLPHQGGIYPAMPMPMPNQQQHHHIHYVPQTHTVIESQPPQTTIIVAPNVGPDPTMVRCPSCRESVVSRMEYENSTRTHVAAGILCILGCWLCCCFPYCMDSCRNGNHYCPSCGAFLGTYRS